MDSFWDAWNKDLFLMISRCSCTLGSTVVVEFNDIRIYRLAVYNENQISNV